MSSFVQRMIGAAKLDVHTYEEVEADQTAMGPAMAVVVISSVAAGIGALGTGGVLGLLVGAVVALVGWFIWAFITYVVGTKLLPEPQTHADMGQLLRTIGFSASPGILRVLGFIPVVGALISFLAGIWMLVAMVVAVRQALDYSSTWRAVAVCVIGFVIYILITIAIGLAFAAFAAGAAGVAG